jgi:Mrp family chromosome partitioning ATPase
MLSMRRIKHVVAVFGYSSPRGKSENFAGLANLLI